MSMEDKYGCQRKNDTFAFAIDVGGKAAGSVGVFRQGDIHGQRWCFPTRGYIWAALAFSDKGISIGRQRNLDTILLKNICAMMF